MPYSTFYGFDARHEALLRGEVTATPGIPSVQTYTDMIAIPGTQTLYDRSGARVDATHRMTFPDALVPEKVRQYRRDKIFLQSPAQIEVPDALDIVEQPVLYGGVLFQHYGHFLLDSMSRLWAQSSYPDLPVAFIPAAKWRNEPNYGMPVLNALGITDRMITVSRPTLFRQVICPSSAREDRYRVYCDVEDVPHKIAAEVLIRKATKRWTRPVYLTRSGLGNARRSPQEPELEAELVEHGFDIVRPETLPLPDQIAIFEQAPIVVGTIGSALHTAMFSRYSSDKTVAVLSWGHGANHFLLMDAVKRHRGIYLNALTPQGHRADVDMNVPLALDLMRESGIISRVARKMHLMHK